MSDRFVRVAACDELRKDGGIQRTVGDREVGLFKVPVYSWNGQMKATFAAPTFNEFVIELPMEARAALDALKDAHIYGGVNLSRWYPEMENHLLVCVTEMKTLLIHNL
jgi:glycine dehydrogenase subunit 1